MWLKPYSQEHERVAHKDMTEPVVVFGLTASNILALSGIGLSAFLGFLAYRTGKDARKDAHDIATEARQSEERRARAERIHANRRETYVNVLEHVYLTQDYVTRTKPIMSFTNDLAPPEFPPDAAVRRLNASVAAFGSADVLARLEKLTGLANEFGSAVFMLNQHEESRRLTEESGAKTMGAWKDVEEKRKTFLAATKEVRAAINRELSE